MSYFIRESGYIYSRFSRSRHNIILNTFHVILVLWSLLSTGAFFLIFLFPTSYYSLVVYFVINVARILNGVKLSDKLRSRVLIAKLNFLSVNQLNAQTKLLEMWKATNIKDYPIKVPQVSRSDETAVTRSSDSMLITESGITGLSQITFLNYARHVWNKAPVELRKCSSLYSVKRVIKSFVKTLPF